MRSRMGVVAGVLAYPAIFAAIAHAQDPTGPAYGGPGADVDSQVGAAAGGAAGGLLPLTGSSLVLVVLIAVILIALSVLTLRLTRSRTVR